MKGLVPLTIEVEYFSRGDRVGLMLIGSREYFIYLATKKEAQILLAPESEIQNPFSKVSQAYKELRMSILNRIEDYLYFYVEGYMHQLDLKSVTPSCETLLGKLI